MKAAGPRKNSCKLCHPVIFIGGSKINRDNKVKYCKALTFMGWQFRPGLLWHYSSLFTSCFHLFFFFVFPDVESSFSKHVHPFMSPFEASCRFCSEVGKILSRLGGSCFEKQLFWGLKKRKILGSEEFFRRDEKIFRCEFLRRKKI